MHDIACLVSSGLVAIQKRKDYAFRRQFSGAKYYTVLLVTSYFAAVTL